MTLRKTGRRKKARKGDFKPTQEYIERATKEYLNRGGKITRVGILPDINEDAPCGDYGADEFLMGAYL